MYFSSENSLCSSHKYVIKVVNSSIIILYAVDTWTIQKEDERRLVAHEIRRYRNMLNIRCHQ